MNFCTGCNKERPALRTDSTRCGVCSRPFVLVRAGSAQAEPAAPDGETFDMFAAPAEPVREIVVNRETKNGAVVSLLESARMLRTVFNVTVDRKPLSVGDGWVPGPYLEMVGGKRYGARLNDMKNAGLLEYESRHLAGSVWIYRATAIRARAA